jgi:uncharacterized RDD family membrane protein YckC
MSDTPSLHRIRARAAIAVGVVVALSAGAAAQTPATSNARRARVVQASTAVDPLPPQDRTNDERPFRFTRPIVRVGQDYVLQRDDAVREITSILADLTIEGKVDGDVAVVVGSARLASTATVQGSVVVVGGSLTIDPGAAIHNDVVVVGGSHTAPADFRQEGHQVVIGTPVAGAALRAVVPWITYGLIWGRLIVPTIDWVWGIVGIFFLIYFVLNAVFRDPVRVCADTVRARPISAFLLGLLVLVLSIPALAILAATVIGLAVVPFVLCGLFVGALIGKVGVIRAIGRGIAGESSEDSRIQPMRSFVIGFIVLTLAYTVPVLGIVVWAITGVLGIGAATTAFRASLRREHPPRVRTPEPVVAANAEPQPAYAGEPAPVAPASAFVPEPPVNLNAAGMDTTAPPPQAHVPADLAVYPRATFLDRVAAFALDAILVAIAVNLLDLTRHGDGWYPLLLLAYHIAFWAWRGTTLGGIIIGLRVVRVQGTDLRFADALVRGLTSIFSIAALGIGCLWMLHDPEKQMWHDKIAGTLVVKVPRHLVLP